MTHEELLAKISSIHNEGSDLGELVNKQYKAMLKFEDAVHAVVELHKPTPENRYPENICQICSMTEEGIYVYYPCQTIEAIEKELK